MRFHLSKCGYVLPYIAATTSGIKVWCIKVYPQIKKSVRRFLGLFKHEAAKYFCKHFWDRAFMGAWFVFASLTTLSVLLAGTIPYQPESGNAPVVITRELATQMVIAFVIILALGFVIVVIKTIRFASDWKKGKQPITLTTISQRLESTESRLAVIEQTFGQFKHERKTELIGINKRLDNIETKTNDRLKAIEAILKSLIKDRERRKKS